MEVHCRCGRIELVEKEVLDRFGSEALGAVDLVAMSEAFMVRRNVVNMKKVAGHLLEALEDVQEDLARAASWHFTDYEGERYVRSASAYATARAALVSARDARTATKAIARINRDPRATNWLPRDLRDMVFETSKMLDHVDSSSSREKKKTHFTFDNETSLKKKSLGGEELQRDPFSHVCLEPILKMASALSDFVGRDVSFEVKEFLVQRGAAKALRMRYEVTRVRKAFEGLLERLESPFIEEDDSLTFYGAQARRQKALRARQGATPIIAKLAVRGLRSIEERGFEEELFAASDDRFAQTVVAPKECLLESSDLSDIFEAAKRFREEELPLHVIPEMELKTEISLRDDTSRVARVFRGSRICSVCGLSFSRQWLTRASKFRACVRCDRLARLEGHCPVASSRCEQQRSWCPHFLRCFACEEVSCYECGLVALDGRGLSSLVLDDDLDVQCLYLDFDRTIASTRCGASPLAKNTVSCDPDLAHLARNHDNVRVVTRNRHTHDITLFLQMNDFPVAGVHNVPKNHSKADVVLQNNLKGDLVVFADDDIKELLDPRLDDAAKKKNTGRLLRVLFSRGTAATTSSAS